MNKKGKTLEESLLTLRRFDKSNKFTIAFIASMVFLSFIQAFMIGNNLMLMFMAAAFMSILALYMQLTENTRALTLLYDRLTLVDELNKTESEKEVAGNIKD